MTSQPLYLVDSRHRWICIWRDDRTTVSPLLRRCRWRNSVVLRTSTSAASVAPVARRSRQRLPATFGHRAASDQKHAARCVVDSAAEQARTSWRARRALTLTARRSLRRRRHLHHSSSVELTVYSLTLAISVAYVGLAVTALQLHQEQEVKVIWQKAHHGGPIPRLWVTPGGRKLYHWIPGVRFPISVPY